MFLPQRHHLCPVRAISEAMGMDETFLQLYHPHGQRTTADWTASQQGVSSASGNYISADRAGSP